MVAFIFSSLSFLTCLSFFDNIENKFVDLRFKQKYATARRNSLKEIVIADIDSRSIKKMNRYFNWTRDYYAQLIDVLNKKRTAIVGFDILFNRSNDAGKDSLLVNSVKKGKTKVFMGYNFSSPDIYNFLYPDSVIDKSLKLNENTIKNDNFQTIEKEILDIDYQELYNASFCGFLNMSHDEDGVIRKTPLLIRYQGQLYPSFGLNICLEKFKIGINDLILENGKSLTLKNCQINDSLKKDIKIPLDENNEMIINYKGPWQTFRTISFYDIYADRVGSRAFRDKIVIVGASLRGLMDLRSTPIQEVFPGVEVHANIINTIIKQDFISETKKSLILLLVFFFIVLTILIVFNIKSFYFTIIMTSSLAISYHYLVFYFFNKHNLLLDYSRPMATIAISFIVSYLVKYYLQEKDKKMIKNTLGKYVPKQVSDEMLKDTSKLRLGGEKKYITMLFSDIRNFTKKSEKCTPEEVIQYLNNYLTEMSNIIKDNNGTLDKFIGDAVVCLFGTPLKSNHPCEACSTALKMIEKLAEINKLSKSNFGKVEIGIGINSGEVTVGNVGSSDLFDYTAIGDGMNLASRIEGINKTYKTNILISETTFNEIKDQFIIREIDTVIVKGKNEPITLYELLDFSDGINIGENKKKALSSYAAGLKFYRKGEFKKALLEFEKTLEYESFDGPAEVMLKRTNSLLAEGISLADWNGIWKFKHK